MNILLIDDSEDNTVIVKMFLKKLCQSFHHEENGQLGLEYFKTHHKNIDLVLMDLEMPVMNGIDASVAIRSFEQEASLQETPILAITAHSMDAELEKVKACGMNGHIAKPIMKDKLISAVQEFDKSKS